MRRLLPGCARIGSDKMAANPPRKTINSRRLMNAPKASGTSILKAPTSPLIGVKPNSPAACRAWLVAGAYFLRATEAGFGSFADMASPRRHVRFTPESGHCNRDTECRLRASFGLTHRSKPD